MGGSLDGIMASGRGSADAVALDYTPFYHVTQRHGLDTRLTYGCSDGSV